MAFAYQVQLDFPPEDLMGKFTNCKLSFPIALKDLSDPTQVIWRV